MALQGAKLVPFEIQMLLSELCYPGLNDLPSGVFPWVSPGVAAGSRSAAAVSPPLRATAMSHPEFLQCARKSLSEGAVLGGIYCQSCGAQLGQLW